MEQFQDVAAPARAVFPWPIEPLGCAGNQVYLKNLTLTDTLGQQFLLLHR